MADYVNSSVFNYFPPDLQMSENATHSVFLLSDRLIFDGSTAVEPEIIDFAKSAILFPNPASNTLWVQFENPISDVELMFYNSMGVLVESIYVSSERTVALSLADFPEGVYFISAEKGGERYLIDKLVLIR